MASFLRHPSANGPYIMWVPADGASYAPPYVPKISDNFSKYLNTLPKASSHLYFAPNSSSRISEAYGLYQNGGVYSALYRDNGSYRYVTPTTINMTKGADGTWRASPKAQALTASALGATLLRKGGGLMTKVLPLVSAATSAYALYQGAKSLWDWYKGDAEKKVKDKVGGGGHHGQPKQDPIIYIHPDASIDPESDFLKLNVSSQNPIFNGKKDYRADTEESIYQIKNYFVNLNQLAPDTGDWRYNDQSDWLQLAKDLIDDLIQDGLLQPAATDEVPDPGTLPPNEVLLLFRDIYQDFIIETDFLFENYFWESINDFDKYFMCEDIPLACFFESLQVSSNFDIDCICTALEDISNKIVEGGPCIQLYTGLSEDNTGYAYQ